MLTAIELVRTCLLQRPGGRLLNYGRLSHAPLRDDVHMIPANPLLPLWFHGRSGLPVLQIEDQVMKEARLLRLRDLLPSAPESSIRDCHT